MVASILGTPARRWTGAYYLAGYAVECGLKACIAKLMRAEEFQDRIFADKCWTHSLAQLFSLADLKVELDTAMQKDSDLRDNWDIVKEWTESTRYSRKTKTEAKDLYEAIADNKHGVLPWLKRRW